MYTNIDLSTAKTVQQDFLKGYQGSPIKLYQDLQGSNLSLSDKLEELDPSELDEQGKPKHLDALQRQLVVNEIQLTGPKAVTIEQLAIPANMVLMPELVLREIIAGMGMASRSDYRKLVATRNVITGAKYHPIYIPNQNLTDKVGRAAKTLAKRASVGQGAEFPKLTFRYREKDITVKDYGRALAVTYKVIKNMPWEEFRIILHLIGVQLVADMIFDIYDLGINGDGTVGAATNTFSGTAGTLTYQDLVDNYVSFDEAFSMNALLCPQTSLETILVLPQFQDPQAGFEFQRTGKMVTPIGGELFQIYTTAGGVPAAKVIVTLDRRFAVRETNSQVLMVEADKIINQKFEEAVISQETVFSILADGALSRIVWT